MKRRRAEEIAQYGYIVTMVLFIIFVVLGLMLDNEFIIILGVLFLLYIPAYVVILCIDGIWDELKDRKRKKKREQEQWICPHCEIVYEQNELDILPSEQPFCQDCGKQLVRKRNRRKKH